MKVIACKHIRLMPSAADAEVPGGAALLDALLQCKHVLMLPNTPIEDPKGPDLRPGHEVDLTCLAPPSGQGESLSVASLYSRASVLRHMLESAFRPCAG